MAAPCCLTVVIVIQSLLKGRLPDDWNDLQLQPSTIANVSLPCNKLNSLSAKKKISMLYLENYCLGYSTIDKGVTDTPDAVAEYFHVKINALLLKTQLAMLPDAVKTTYESSSVKVNQVTQVTIWEDALLHGSYSGC